MTFLVADANLAVEDLLIGLPVLQHLDIDTKTLLEQKRDVLDGFDCSSIRNTPSGTRGGQVSRLMIARLNRVSNSDAEPSLTSKADRPHVDYYQVREEPDPFPDKSLLDPVDSEQHADVTEAIDKIVQDASDSGFTPAKLPELKEIVSTHMDIFRTSFSSGPPAGFPPLKIDLAPNAVPVLVRLRNYSQAQRNFLSRTVSKLVKCGMAYPNPTSPWASAPLLVAKPGPAEFRFTVDLRPVNCFTIKHQFPMPNIEQELSKTADSECFSNFEMSHSY